MAQSISQLYAAKLAEAQQLYKSHASKADFKELDFSAMLQDAYDKALASCGLQPPNRSAASALDETSKLYEAAFEVNQDSRASTDYDSLIEQLSASYGVDASLIKALIQVESSYNPNAVSSAGAQGLMQLMPGTAAGLGVTDPFDPTQNIEGGIKYIKQMLDRFNGNVNLALAAYNMGPNRVESILADAGLDKANVGGEYAQVFSDRMMNYIDKVLSKTIAAAP